MDTRSASEVLLTDIQLLQHRTKGAPLQFAALYDRPTLSEMEQPMAALAAAGVEAYLQVNTSGVSSGSPHELSPGHRSRSYLKARMSRAILPAMSASLIPTSCRRHLQ